MKLGNVRVAIFSGDNKDTVAAAANSWMGGKDIVGPGSPAQGEVKDQEFLDIQFNWDGATFVIFIAYAE